MAEDKIFKVKLDMSAAVKGLADYEKQIQQVIADENELKKAMKDGTATDEQRQNYEKLKLVHKELTAAKRDLEKEITNERKLNQELDGSLNSLKARASLLKQQIDKLSEADRNNADIGGKLIAQRKEIIDKLKEEEKAYGDTYRNVGNYEEAIKNAMQSNNKYIAALQGLLGKFAQQGEAVSQAGATATAQAANGAKGASVLTGAMAGLTTSLKALWASLTSLMANPAFLVIAGIGGAISLAKMWFDYNKGVEEATRLTKEFTGALPREELDHIRTQTEAIGEVYDKDYKEVMQAADALVANFGVTWEQALSVIRKGFVAGADLNGDFLNKVQSSAGAMGALGISTESFVGYLKETTTGIFSDEGLTLISKAGVNLRKMTDTTKKDLQAIGVDVKEVQNLIANGNVEQAIKNVAQGLANADSNSKAYANAMADVFGAKAQMNAQKMIEYIGGMGTNLDSMTESASNFNKLQDDLVKSEAELNAALDDVFGGWGEWVDTIGTKFKIFWADVKKYSVLTIRTAVDGWVLGFHTIWGGFETLLRQIGAGAEYIATQFKNVGGIIADMWDAILSGNFDAVGDAFTKGWERIKSTAYDLSAWNNYKNTISHDWDKLMHSFDVPDYSTTESSTTASGKTTTTTTTASGKGTVKDRSANELAELRKAEDLKNKLLGESAEQQRKTIAQGYDRQIADLKTRLAKEKELTKVEREAINSQIVSLEALKNKDLDAFDKQREAEALKFANELLSKRLEVAQRGSDEEIAMRREQLNNQHALDLQNLEATTLTAEQKAQMRLAIEAKYQSDLATLTDQARAVETQRAQLDFEQRQMNATTELERLQIELEEQKYLRDTARQMEGESAEEWRQRQLQLQANYVAAQKTLADKEVQVQTAKYKAISGTLGAASSLLGEFGKESKAAAIASKALALGEIAINQGVAIAAGIKQAQSVPFPANIAAIATTITTILTGIVSAVKTVKSAKFADGGLVTGAGTGTSDSINARLSNGESVMTAKATAMFAPLLSSLNVAGGGVPIQVQSAGTAQIGEDMLAAAFAKGVASLPAPVVSVAEINDVQNRVNVIESVARL